MYSQNMVTAYSIIKTVTYFLLRTNLNVHNFPLIQCICTSKPQVPNLFFVAAQLPLRMLLHICTSKESKPQPYLKTPGPEPLLRGCFGKCSSIFLGQPPQVPNLFFVAALANAPAYFWAMKRVNLSMPCPRGTKMMLMLAAGATLIGMALD
jgi:hypothetical protein